jgi:hypothetical protein
MASARSRPPAPRLTVLTLWAGVTAGCAVGGPPAAGAAAFAVNPAPASSAATPSASSPPQLAAASPAASPHALCEALARDQRAALRPYFDEERRTSGAFDGRGFVRRFCWPDTAGVWGVSFSAIEVTPSKLIKIPYRSEAGPFVSATLSLVRVGLDGRRLSGKPRPYSWIAGQEGSAFDWNGDGVAELAFPQGAGSAELAIWTVASGAIAPYAPAADIAVRAVEDLDGDGRPDLLYTAPFSGEMELPDAMDTSLYLRPHEGGFWLVAHALPDGTFSRDDEVAREYARKECPAGDLDVRDRNWPEDEALAVAQAVRCAKLHGVERGKIEAFLDRKCKQRRGCLNEAKLRGWAAAAAPLRL